MPLRPFLYALAALCLPAAAAAETIAGTVTYRERIALPPGAVLEVELVERSEAGATPARIAATMQEEPGAPPFAFAIEVDPADLAPEGAYGLRATVTVEGRLLMTTTKIAAVEIGTLEPAELLLRIAEAEPAPPLEPGRAGAHGLILPATFRGTLPSAGPGVDWQLDLWPDQSYHLVRRYIDRDGPPVMALGRWHVEPETRTLVLADAGSEEPLQLAIAADQSLRLLDRFGRPIASELDYSLRSEGTLDPAPIDLPMRGMVTVTEEGATFMECRTGRTYQVAAEADWPALERAYLAAADAPRQPIMATVDGTIAPRETDGKSEAALVVERFTALWTDETCVRPLREAPLENVYWRIAALKGEPIPALEGSREPHLLLRPLEREFAATVGCNRLAGGYALSGTDLSFTPGPSTLMACPEPLDAAERRLAGLLPEVESYRLNVQTLELLDGSGSPLATLRAVYLP